ncbi:unnamed protein product, partial [Hapterophycus canaliculatus]
FGYGQQQSWRRCEELGRGAHGTVYRALVLETGESIAVKQILTAGMSRSELQVAENEIGMLRKLRHPNIVPFLGVQRVDNHLNIFLEYMEEGCLRRLLDRDGPMSEGQAAVITTSILTGLSYLHSNDIAHRDIKGANVLLSKNGAVKLADFGTSKPMNQISVVSGLKGTPNWMAPEVIRNQVVQGAWPQADVWSVGCTVVEMLTGEVPWPAICPMSALWKIADGGKPPLNRDVSLEAASFMEACMATEPSQRHTVEQLMEHNFLVGARSPGAAVASFSRQQARPSPSPNAEDDRHQHHHHHHHHYFHNLGGDGDRGEALDGSQQQRHALSFSMHVESTDRSEEFGGSSGGFGSSSNSGDYDRRHNLPQFHRQEKMAGPEGRRPPCRSRQTADDGKVEPRLRNARGAGSGGDGSGLGEGGDDHRCQGRWQQEPRGPARRVGGNRAPPSTPTSGSDVSTRLSPRAAAAA